MTIERTHPVLIVSDRKRWCEALLLSLELVPTEVEGASYDQSIDRAREVDPASIVIDTDDDVPGSYGTFERAARLTRALRARHPTLPFVLMTETPRDDFSDLAIEVGRARVLLPERPANPEALASEVMMAVSTCPTIDVPQDAEYATVEITVRWASVHFDIRTNGAIRFIGPRAFTSRDQLQHLNDEFGLYESNDDEFKKVGLGQMNLAGRRLRTALKGPLGVARQFQPKTIARTGQIHYRFGHSDGDLDFVPFEVMSTDNDNEFLRDLHPISRRLISREEHLNPDRGLGAGKPRLRLLFILSPASGLLSVSPYKFRERDDATLNKLAHLETEAKDLLGLYAEEQEHDQVKFLQLSPDGDNISRIEQAFAENDFDIVHFAGHSARADGIASRKVFLALPAPTGSKTVVAYDAEDFARLVSDGQTRLVILSSCEGASGQTLSRMASRGVPAVAGFRWPVIDQHASFFTVELHRQLKMEDGRVSLSVAFHKALLALRSRAAGKLTAFSPVLMLQRSAWHDFHLGV